MRSIHNCAKDMQQMSVYRSQPYTKKQEAESLVFVQQLQTFARYISEGVCTQSVQILLVK